MKELQGAGRGEVDASAACAARIEATRGRAVTASTSAAVHGVASSSLRGSVPSTIRMLRAAARIRVRGVTTLLDALTC
jgi:hypothetical protein